MSVGLSVTLPRFIPRNCLERFTETMISTRQLPESSHDSVATQFAVATAQRV